MSDLKSIALTVLNWSDGLDHGAQTHIHTDTHRTKTVSPPFTPFNSKGTIGPGRRPLAYLAYYVLIVSPACA